MNFDIRYLTEYRYETKVADNLNALRVRPATTSTQRVDDFHVRVDPEARLQRHLDYYGTEVIEFGVAQPHDHLSIDVRAHVVTAERGQALALLQAVGGFQAFRRAVPAPPNALPVARFLLFERGYPDSVAASVDAVHNALIRADRNPRNSEPVLRLQRLSADLEFRGRAEADGADLHAICESVQEELVRVDRDIADRYFAGAPATMVST